MRDSIHRPLIKHLVAASVCLLASPLVNAAGPNCAAMEDAGPQWFATQLDAVQASYQSGNSQGAYQQLRSAMMGLPRHADVSLDARCVGAAQWQRLYQLRRAITQALGKQAEDSGKLAATEGALDWYVTGDNQGDARRVIPQLTPTVEGTTYIINRLRSEISALDQAQASGFELLPEEHAARAFWQKGLDGMIGYARKQAAETLEKEAGLLTRAATAKEEQFEQAQEEQQTRVADLLGDESLATQNEAQREVNRAAASLKMLVAARDWSQAVSDSDTAPVIERALQRGDALLLRANDATLGLEARDSLFAAAGNYFEFAGSSQRQQAAAQGRAAIAPALQAERDARTARIDRKSAEIQQSTQQAKEAMQKTATQKKSFKDEADALESELGF